MGERIPKDVLAKENNSYKIPCLILGSAFPLINLSEKDQQLCIQRCFLLSALGPQVATGNLLTSLRRREFENLPLATRGPKANRTEKETTQQNNVLYKACQPFSLKLIDGDVNKYWASNK